MREERNFSTDSRETTFTWFSEARITPSLNNINEKESKARHAPPMEEENQGGERHTTLALSAAEIPEANK